MSSSPPCILCTTEENSKTYEIDRQTFVFLEWERTYNVTLIQTRVERRIRHDVRGLRNSEKVQWLIESTHLNPRVNQFIVYSLIKQRTKIQSVNFLQLTLYCTLLYHGAITNLRYTLLVCGQILEIRAVKSLSPCLSPF